MWTFVDAFGLKKSASFEHVLYGEVAESPPSFASIVVPDYELSDDDSRALTDMSARVEARLQTIVSMRPVGSVAIE
eukprot:6026807-Amphidinium_carterae.1